MIGYEEIVDLIFPNADEFQRLALIECLRESEGVPFSPDPTPEDEKKLMNLGAIAWEVIRETREP